MNKTSYLSKLILAALFAALTAVFSQIALPLPFTPVPVNLSTLAVFLCGGLLGAKYGLISQVVYMLLGLAGMPVFAQFTAGPGILFGATGGYIFGYAAAAYLAGLLTEHLSTKRKMGFAASVYAFAAALLACYLLGTLWFMYVTKTALAPSLVMCVIPFLSGDALKIVCAALLTRRLRPIFLKM